MEQFIMNNCKIANELRKYRDLAGAINRVTLSADPGNYAEYIITQDLSYLDMITANAVYSLWRSGEGKDGFRAETVGQVMAGNMERRLRPEKQVELEQRLQRLAGTELYILADHDKQVEQDVYEGPLLPLTWESGQRRFYFQTNGQMPLYQYAQEKNQLLAIPFSRLRDDQAANQTKLNNNDRTLLLRHYLLQELEILLYPDNRVDELEIRLFKQDETGAEYGLVWMLGLESGKDASPVLAKRLQKTMEQLLDNLCKSGYVTKEQYSPLTPEQGYGISLKSGNTSKEKGNKKKKN